MFTGIIPPLITPFNDDFSVNESGYAALIEYQIAGGVHAIIVGGTTGENYALSGDERARQFRFAREVIGGRVPMICGVNDMTTGAACALAEAARDAAADGLLVAAPPYSLPTEDELATHCLAVDRAADLPIMLYNYPARTGVNMGENFLRRVAQNKNFRCIKEASGDVSRIHLLVREFPNLALSCGAEDQALEFFVWGASSWVTPMGNFFIDEVVAFYNACAVEKDFDKARRMMHALLPLTSVLEGGGQFAQSVKYACELQSLPAGPVRPPLQAMNGKSKEELREVITRAQTELRDIINTEKNEIAAARMVG